MSQVPFEFAVKEVLEQLRKIAKGEYKTPDTGKRKFGTIVYAAVTLPVTEIKTLLHTVSENPELCLILFLSIQSYHFFNIPDGGLFHESPSLAPFICFRLFV